MAKSKWTDLKKPGVRGPKYLAILNNKLGHIARNDREYMRKLMNANFLGTLEGASGIAEKSKKLAEKINAAIKDGSIKQNNTFINFRHQLKTLSLEYGKFDLDMDHKDVSVIAQQLQFTLDALKYQKEAYDTKAAGGPDLTVPSGSAVGPKSIDNIIAKMKELILLEESLAAEWEGDEDLALSDVSDIIHIMDKNKRGTFVINKTKNIQAADGPVMTLQIVDRWKHSTKNKLQAHIGARRAELLTGQDPTGGQAQALGRELEKAGIGKIIGSENLWNAYTKGFKQLMKTGRFKPYKSKSGGTWKGVRAPALQKSKAKLRKIAVQAAYTKALLKEAAAAGTVKREDRYSNIAKALIGIRTKVNRKLPAEIRRNMGREGRLTNRTGRFSQSAVLADLRPSPAGKTVMAKYTYLLNPYQTFENTGQRRWPMSYNPKPLISRSIRNLAEKEIREQFGLGLTTRRI